MPLERKKGDDGEYELQFSMSGEFKFGYADQPLTLSLVSAMMNEAYKQGARDTAPFVAKLRNILREMPPN